MNRIAMGQLWVSRTDWQVPGGMILVLNVDHESECMGGIWYSPQHCAPVFFGDYDFATLRRCFSLGSDVP